MITITVNGKLHWTGTDQAQAHRRLEQVLKTAAPKSTIVLSEGGTHRLRISAPAR